MPTSITGNVKDILGVANVAGVKVRLSLKWSGNGTPRVNGAALVLSSGASGNDRVISDMAIDSSGAITGSVYSTRDAAGTGNGEIEVNGSLTACYYEVQISKIGGQTFKFPVHAKNGASLDLTNVTPISTDPIVAAPTGDTTYARLDGGNSPFTGLMQFLQGILLALGKSVAWSTDLFLGRGAAGKLTVGTTAGASDGTVSAAAYQVGGVSQSGTGPLAGTVSPVLTTPNIGVAIATSIAVGGGTALTTTNRTGTGNLALATSPTLTTPTLTTPVINGTPTGTGIPTVTLKKGTGSGNYNGTNTSFANVDGTNLSYTVTIPVGWKLSVEVNAAVFITTATAGVALAIVDGSVVVENQITATLNVTTESNLGWVINGDGASHTITLQAKTTIGADAWNIFNDTATRVPTMIFLLTPSN